MNVRLRNLFLPSLIYFLIRLSTVFFSSFSAAPFEEQYTGVMARLLTSDSGIPWFELSMGPQEMIGRTFIAWLCAGSFWVFGTNLVALKLPAVLLSTISFFLWHALLLRFSDRFAMWISASLWCFPPPLIQGISIISFGNHWENSLNFAIVLVCLSIWHDRTPENRWLMLVGFSAGVSIAFCQNAIPLVISAVTVLLVFDRKSLRIGNISTATAAFFLPLILFSVLMRLRTGSFFSLYNISSDTVCSVCTIHMIVRRLQECFLEHLPLSAVTALVASEDTVDLITLRYTSAIWLLSAGFLSSAVLLWRERTRRIASVSTGFIIIFCCAWSFSGHSIAATGGYLTYRYFSVLYPFFFLLIALGLRSISLPAKRFLSYLAILPIVIPNFLYYVSLIDPSSFNRAVSANGALWTTVSEWLVYSHNSPGDDRRSSADRSRLLHSMAKITNPQERDQIAWGLGGQMAVLFPDSGPLNEKLRSLGNMPDEFACARSAVSAGLTAALPLAGVMTPDELAISISREHEDYRSEFFTGLGISIGLVNGRTGQNNFVTWALIPEKYRENVAFGYGFSLPIASWGQRSFRTDYQVPCVFDHMARNSFAYGFGKAMAWLYPDSTRTARWMESFFYHKELQVVMETAYYSTLRNTQTISW